MKQAVTEKRRSINVRVKLMVTIIFLSVLAAQNLAAQAGSVTTVGELLEQGRLLAAAGNDAAALAVFTKAIEIDPSEVGAYGYRGMTNRRLGNYQQAVEDFTKVLELSPQDRGYLERGSTYHLMREYQLALDDLNRAIDANPRYRDAYVNRGSTYIQLGDNGRAIEDFNKAIELDPKNGVAYYNRALAYQRTGNTQQYEQDMKVAADLGMALAKDKINRDKVTLLQPDASSTANEGATQNATQSDSTQVPVRQSQGIQPNAATSEIKDMMGESSPIRLIRQLGFRLAFELFIVAVSCGLGALGLWLLAFKK